MVGVFLCCEAFGGYGSWWWKDKGGRGFLFYKDSPVWAQCKVTPWMQTGWLRWTHSTSISTPMLHYKSAHTTFVFTCCWLAELKELLVISLSCLLGLTKQGNVINVCWLSHIIVPVHNAETNTSPIWMYWNWTYMRKGFNQLFIFCPWYDRKLALDKVLSSRGQLHWGPVIGADEVQLSLKTNGPSGNC